VFRRSLRVGVHEDSEIPVRVDLVSKQKDAIKEQNRIRPDRKGRRVLGHILCNQPGSSVTLLYNALANICRSDPP